MGTPAREWTPDAIRSFLEEEELGYQRIELPYGLHTPGEDAIDRFDLVFDADMTGKSVLDVGSYLGAYCLEASRRGATRVVGWEINPARLRQARMLADICGLDPVYENKDIEVDDIDERFDVVLGLNILHHMRNPALVIDKLVAATTGRLALEVASIGEHDRRKLEISWATARRMEKLPVVFVGHGRTTGGSRASSQTYFYTAPALRRILTTHRAAFALGQVDFSHSAAKDRFLVVAERPVIPELIVVAGPTSAGKSTLVAELQAGGSATLAGHVALSEPSRWLAVGASHLDDVSVDGAQGVILHYDLLRPYGRSTVTFRRDEALDLLGSARKVTVVTLLVSPSRLQQQLWNSELAPGTTRRWTARRILATSVRAVAGFGAGVLARLRRQPRPTDVHVPEQRRHSHLHRMYARPGWLREQYERWFTYIDSLGSALPVVSNLVVRRLDDGETTVLDDWRRAIEPYPSGPQGSSGP